MVPRTSGEDGFLWIAAVQRGVLCDGRLPATEQESWFPSTPPGDESLCPAPLQMVPSSHSGVMTVLLSAGEIPECPMDNNRLSSPAPLGLGRKQDDEELGGGGVSREMEEVDR